MSAEAMNAGAADLPAAGARRPGSATPLRGGRLFRRWFAFVTVGETLGFLAPACAGALSANAPVTISLAVILGAGAVEGTLLGLAQAMVLRRALPALSGRRWVAVTAAAAVFAYVIGMIPATFPGAVAAAGPLVLTGAGVLLGSALLLSIGTAQWTVLRAGVPRSASWILTTALAWIAGLGVFLAFAMPLWQPGQPMPLTVVIGVTGGLLMAAVSAAVTGEALRRLLRRNPVGVTGRIGP